MSNNLGTSFWFSGDIQMNKLYLINKIEDNDFDKKLDLECENIINEIKSKIIIDTKQLSDDKIALITGFISGIASTSLTFGLALGYLNVEQIVDTFLGLFY
jgi:hypothetical protein